MTTLFALSLDPKALLESGSYLLLFTIIFAESGMLVGFFLPGDSLLFTAGAIAGGALSKQVDIDLNIFLVCLGCCAAAIIGDQVGFMIGSRAGRSLLERDRGFILKKETLDKAVARTEEFFEHYGAKAIILARFVPVVRTFVPPVAGVSKMHYGTFVRFNVIGGAIWGIGIPLLGYYFGKIPFIQEHYEISLLAIVGISFLPIIWEGYKHWSAAKARKATQSSGEPVQETDTSAGRR